ncbi:MAG TPA: MBL fold metallo-hydrolase [Solirubrobacteraceae bacterium]|jgi:glyoxylase-like metal-dependent hydrolase (beta-lactamase superfamily II)|nr:MBL fold metallo-hydrolase [Solirubrobacteraceae bacterium]
MSTSPSGGAEGEEAGVTIEGASSEQTSEARLLREHDILRLRAANPGPVTLSGTNTWVVGREPAWVVDPGPRLDEHLEALFDAVDDRGGLGGIALTHDHQDHREAVPAVLARHPAPVAGGRGEVDVLLEEGKRVGPFEPVATPGHAAGHFALIADGACFTGDAVLGEGSVFISPYRDAMAGYLRALTRLDARADLDVLCPGHGPPVWDPHAKLREYFDHRIDRENKLIAALGRGCRSVQELLDAVWSDVPEALRGLATVTLAAHLDKLADEHVLPAGVERPRFERTEW